jgi:hypothetical protein
MASGETAAADIIGGTGGMPTTEAGEIELPKSTIWQDGGFGQLASRLFWVCFWYVSISKATKLSAATDRGQTGFTGLGEKNLSYVLGLDKLSVSND